MNDDARLSYAHDMPMSCEAHVHHLTGSSAPGGGAPAFRPLAREQPILIEDVSPDCDLVAAAAHLTALVRDELALADRLNGLQQHLSFVLPSQNDRSREEINAYMLELARLEASVQKHTTETGRASLAGAKRIRSAIECLGQAEEEAWQSACDEIRAVLGLDDLQREHEAVRRDLEYTARRLTHMRPTTTAGLLAKAEISIALNRDYEENWAAALTDMSLRETVMLLAPLPAQESASNTAVAAA